MTRAPFDPRIELEPVSEIVDGLLWQGMRPATYVGYDVAVSCEWHLARRPMTGYMGITLQVPMRDEDDFVVPERLVICTAELIASAMGRGVRVLVHCTGGLNRSSVVSARALERYFGCTAREAVDLLRERRNEFCLCNRQFERWVLGDRLPTAETTTLGEGVA